MDGGEEVGVKLVITELQLSIQVAQASEGGGLLPLPGLNITTTKSSAKAEPDLWSSETLLISSWQIVWGVALKYTTSCASSLVI